MTNFQSCNFQKIGGKQSRYILYEYLSNMFNHYIRYKNKVEYPGEINYEICLKSNVIVNCEKVEYNKSKSVINIYIFRGMKLIFKTFHLKSISLNQVQNA